LLTFSGSPNFADLTPIVLRPIPEFDMEQRLMETSAITQSSARVIGWLCIALISVASLVPGSMRPHAGLPGPVEHALAYCLTGAILCIGYSGPRERLFFWISLASCSALFEILQHFVPGRSPAVVDSLASIAGLTVGFGAGAAIQTVFRFNRG
jgi:hypothetical protein